MATPIDVVFKYRKNCPTGNRVLFTGPKNSAASQTVATALIAPKNARVCPQQCAHSAPGFIEVGSLSVEL